MAIIEPGDVFIIEKGRLKRKRGGSTSEIGITCHTSAGVVSVQRVGDDEIIYTTKDGKNYQIKGSSERLI